MHLVLTLLIGRGQVLSAPHIPHIDGRLKNAPNCLQVLSALPALPIRNPRLRLAQCSATPASVAATPPCSATPLQRQLDARHSWQFKGDRCDRAF